VRRRKPLRPTCGQGSLYEIIGLHGPTLYPFPYGKGSTAHPFLEDCLRALHRAGIGDFRLLKDEWPTFREIALPLEAAVSGETMEGDGIRPEGTAETYRLFLLAEPWFVYGIRLTYWVPRPSRATIWLPLR
jgi:hypothetical protein